MSANSTILGDSWVVEAAATPPPNKHRHEAKQPPNASAPRATPDQTKKSPSSPSDTRTNDYGSESMATSVSSVSGPELIMPSIYETPVPEGSWIAPNVRSPQHTIKRRHHGRERTQPNPSNTSPQKDQTPQGDGKPNHDQDQHPQNVPDSDNNRPSLLHRLQPTLRLLLNALLLASIAHLLVLPELITQHQPFFCSIPAIPSLYPSSCLPPHFLLPNNPIQSFTTTKATSPNHPPLTPEEQLTLHATRLERLFTSTLNTLTPLPPVLKQSESRLRTLQSDLRTAFRGSRHELELEFSGLWDAARAGTRKLDSLSADLRSAVDNLIATNADTTSPPSPPRGGRAPPPADNVNGGGKGGGGGQGHRHEAAHANANANAHAKAQVRAAQITSAQLSRREAYLDQLTSRMQGKADALASDLATVEDHLESIERIILREDDSSSRSYSSSQTQEQKRNQNRNHENIHGGQAGGKIAQNLITHLQSLRTEGLGLKALGLGGRGGGVHQPPSSHESSGTGPSKHEAFVAATKGHRAVAEAVRNLSQRLDAVQGRKI